MRDAAPLIAAFCRSYLPALGVRFLDSTVQSKPDEVQHARIVDPAGQRFHQIKVGNGAEVVGKVGVHDMLARKPRMLVTVAMANKMARIVWVLMAHGGSYRAPAAAG